MINIKTPINYDLITEDELVDVMLQERDEMFKQLNKALTYMKGHEVIVDTWNGIMTYQYYENFDFSCFSNCKDQLLLDFKDEEEETPSITIKLEDIEYVEIDDNTEFIESGEMNEYQVEDIVITLENGLVVRLELQWQ